jgi:hypothetical protein
MKIKILLPILLTQVLFTTGYAQTLDKAKLDHFLTGLDDRA